MSGQEKSVERLRNYLRQLPVQARAMLSAEFERAIESGTETKAADLVLMALRDVEAGVSAGAPVVGDAERDESAADVDPAEPLFKCLDPFLVDRGKAPPCPGRIDRGSLSAIWTWLHRDAMPAEIAAFSKAVTDRQQSQDGPARDLLVRQFQIRIAEMIAENSASSEGRQMFARLGQRSTIDDLETVSVAFMHRELLEGIASRFSSPIPDLGPDQIHAVQSAIDLPSLQSPQGLALALALVLKRLGSPYQIVRLAVAAIGTDNSARIAATPFSVAVTIALSDITSEIEALRAALRRGNQGIAQQLKKVHDAIRGLRTELDIRPASAWGRQLASLRAEVSNLLKSEIDSTTGRIRRLLRPRSKKDGGVALDAIDVEETAQLIELVSICRAFASELAINEVTLRTYSDIKQYLEASTQVLLDGLRTIDVSEIQLRRSQLDAAIRFCEIIFGKDYAVLMSKAADVAAQAERKSARS